MVIAIDRFISCLFTPIGRYGLGFGDSLHKFPKVYHLLHSGSNNPILLEVSVQWALYLIYHTLHHLIEKMKR